jgi:hypothetical protein
MEDPLYGRVIRQLRTLSRQATEIPDSLVVNKTLQNVEVSSATVADSSEIHVASKDKHKYALKVPRISSESMPELHNVSQSQSLSCLLLITVRRLTAGKQLCGSYFATPTSFHF